MTLKFTGPDSYTLEVDKDELEIFSKGQGVESRKETTDKEHEFKLGEVYNYNGFNFVIEKRDGTNSIDSENNRWLVWFESSADLANAYRSNLTVEPVEEYASALYTFF